MRDETKKNIRVGLLTLAALAVLGFTILNVGRRDQLFTLHTRYTTNFRNVTGLQVGAPVQLNGVTVGFVERITLPTNPEKQRVDVRFTVDADYTERIRQDTRVMVKTTGLLGDKYLEIRGGTAEMERIYEGGLIPGKDAAEVDQFVSSGEDLMQNLLQISSSLKIILRRVEGGEGLLGELTTTPETGERIGDSLQATLLAVRRIAERVERGEGLLGRLLAEDPEVDHLIGDAAATLAQLRDLATTIERDIARDGTAYAALLRDPQAASRVEAALTAIDDAGQALTAAVEELATGNGTLPRLMKDESYADDFLGDLERLMENLRSVADKLDQGDGSAGAFINDPVLYQDLENVVRGVKSSKVVSWFIRNRREKGEELAAAEAETRTPTP